MPGDQLQAELRTVAPTLAGVLLALALLIGLASLRLFRKSRTDSYWRSRRQSGQRGWRLLQLCIFTTLASGLICTASGLTGIALRPTDTPTPVVIIMIVTSTPTRLPASITPSVTTTPTMTATHTPTLFPTAPLTNTSPPTRTPGARLSPSAASATPTLTIPPTLTVTLPPTFTASATLNPSPTASLTLLPTIWPTLAAASLILAPSVATPDATSGSPSSGASLTITALDREISGKFKQFRPVQPSTKFTAGFTRLYYFVEFTQMTVGADWRGALYWNGTLIDHFERQWASEAEGTGTFSFTQASGFQPGRYEISAVSGRIAATDHDGDLQRQSTLKA